MEEKFFIINTTDKLLDIDTDEFGNYIALTDQNEIISDSFRFRLPDEHKFYYVRRLNNELFLVIYILTGKDRANNVFIYNHDGDVQFSFFAGDSIEDVLIFENRIVFTYFDEGIFGEEGPNLEGVAVFDFNGQMLYGFNSSANWIIADCYAACKLNHDRILFYPYTDFQVIELNINTFEWKQLETPGDFVGAKAMVAKQGKLIFHSSYKHKDGFFLWNIAANQVTKLDTFDAWLRGINDGKFMMIKPNGFSIISVF